MIETRKTRKPASRGLFARWRGIFAHWRGLRTAAAAVLVCGALGACTGEQFQKGYILPPGALEQIPIYFDKNRQVQRLANYGLKDGHIFDFISRTTTTSGQELSYLTPLFKLLSFN